MNDFDLRKYLKNNLLLESKEYEKEMDDDQDDDSVPYIDGRPVEEVEEVIPEAGSPMEDSRTEQIIQMLKDMDVDGETMEYILRQVGMDDQMANQLVNNPAEYEDEVSRAVGESRELRGMAEEELHADSSTVHINGRAVDINSLDVDGVDLQDRPDFVDAYFASGNYQDGDELSDEELDYLTSEYPEIVGDLANQY